MDKLRRTSRAHAPRSVWVSYSPVKSSITPPSRKSQRLNATTSASSSPMTDKISRSSRQNETENSDDEMENEVVLVRKKWITTSPLKTPASSSPMTDKIGRSSRQIETDSDDDDLETEVVLIRKKSITTSPQKSAGITGGDKVLTTTTPVPSKRGRPLKWISHESSNEIYEVEKTQGRKQTRISRHTGKDAEPEDSGIEKSNKPVPKNTKQKSKKSDGQDDDIEEGTTPIHKTPRTSRPKEKVVDDKDDDPLQSTTSVPKNTTASKLKGKANNDQDEKAEECTTPKAKNTKASKLKRKATNDQDDDVGESTTPTPKHTRASKFKRKATNDLDDKVEEGTTPTPKNTRSLRPKGNEHDDHGDEIENGTTPVHKNIRSSRYTGKETDAKDEIEKRSIPAHKTTATSSSKVKKIDDKVEPHKVSESQKTKIKITERRVPRECPLPCRESQFEDIAAFLDSNVRFQNSGCIYVSGVPGTGKTAIVQAVIQDFKEYYASKNQAINMIYINGLTLSAPNRIWKRFYKELNPHLKARFTPETAYQKLNLYFEKQHDPIVLIIDELDQILDKRQAIMYRLLDWTVNPKNVFSLICIFNTMHLPESILTLKNSSRMGMVRCAFPPYTHEQLATIVKRSLGDQNSTRLSDALTLLSRKVAAISGDARRALEIAQRTIEIMNENDEGGNTTSSTDAVAQAFKELFSSPKTAAIKQCSEMEKLVLRSVVADLQTTGSEESKVLNVASHAISKAKDDGFEISGDQVFHILKNLFQSKLILMEHDTTSLYNKISLNVAIPDIQYALGAADLNH